MKDFVKRIINHLNRCIPMSLTWGIKTLFIYWKFRKKRIIIRRLAIINNSEIGLYNTFYENSVVTNSRLDDYVYVGPRTIINNTHIARFCSIGPDVKIGLGMHPTDYISTFPAFFSNKKQCQVSFTEDSFYQETGSVKIGNDVWIGANTIILDNVEIGDGAIIGAGSVVTKDVPSYTIVGGVPAKEIRKRFSEDIIELLLDISWWNNDLEWIKKHKDTFKESIYTIDSLNKIK